jgi:hypothetical protein
MAQMAQELACRKVIQYGLSIYVFQMIALFLGKESLEELGFTVQLAFAFSKLLLCCLAIYVWHPNPSHEMPKTSNDGDVLRNTCRFFYCQMLAWGCTYFICPYFVPDFEFDWGMSKGVSTGNYINTYQGAFMLGFALTFIGAAQCDKDAQKIMLQYNMVSTLSALMWMLPMFSPFILKNTSGCVMCGIGQMVFMKLYCSFNLFAAIYACYPADLRVWVFRVSYFTYFMEGYAKVMFPDLAATLLNFDNTGALYFVGCSQLQISLILMAAAQLASKDSKQLLQYNLCAQLLQLLLAKKYGFGAEPYITAVLALFSIFDLYSDYAMERFGSILGGKSGSMKVAASSPAKRRGRSRTPAGKKKK